MGLLDKLKGHKKDDSIKDSNDISDKQAKRASSFGRKSADKQRVTNASSVPNVPTSAAAATGSGTGIPTSAAAASEAVATYPVGGATTVGNGPTATTTTGSSANHTGHAPVAPDNVSTAAIKDGKIGEPDVGSLDRDMQKTSLNSGTAASTTHSYQPHSYDPKNLSQTPFDREAFHKSLGSGVGTTTYESISKAAVVQETIKPSVLEQVHPVFHREHHVIHHQTRIQPVLEQVLLPAKHYVLIDGQKHEITGDAVLNHVVKARDYIPMSGAKPKVTVHQYVDHEPLQGPIKGVGASLINQDVMLEHQRLINTSYEEKAAGRQHNIPTGQVSAVNYMPGQIPVTTVPGHGPSTLAQSSVDRHASTVQQQQQQQPSSPNSRLAADDAVQRLAGRLQDQRATYAA